MMAARGQHAELVQVLLDRGAKANMRNQKGRTARALAKEAGSETILETFDAHARKESAWFGVSRSN